MATGLPDGLMPLAQRLVEAMRGEAVKYVSADKLPDIRLDAARFEAVTDPSNGQSGYEGVWRNGPNERVGRIIFNSDASFYAEYDLCVPHPTRRGWFVEAITAWGRGAEIKAEARLLAMV
jgi:hypothetical protein